MTEQQERVLRMKYAGGLVKHLGLQMYAGAVPALAELIANAWDADAENVHLTLPVNTPLTKKSRIVVEDDGTGMTFDEVNDRFLLVGGDRRKFGQKTKRFRRPVMGRKGIGKLAAFGIAHVVEIRTVKDGWLTAFRMDYDDIIAAAESHAKYVDSYEPAVLEDRKARTGEKEGTRILLSDLQIRNSINADRFRGAKSTCSA